MEMASQELCRYMLDFSVKVNMDLFNQSCDVGLILVKMVQVCVWTASKIDFPRV